MFDFTKWRGAFVAVALMGGITGCAGSAASADQDPAATAADPVSETVPGSPMPSPATNSPTQDKAPPVTVPDPAASHLALVYRGPVVGCDGCSESIAAVLHEDTVVRVLWKGASRTVYFQDGPYFVLDEGSNATVVATYESNGLPAVVVAPLGKGKVAVSGPHLEADQSWFDDVGVKDPTDPKGKNGHALDLATELVDALMAP